MQKIERQKRAVSVALLYKSLLLIIQNRTPESAALIIAEAMVKITFDRASKEST